MNRYYLPLMGAAKRLLRAKDNQMETEKEWKDLREAVEAAERNELIARVCIDAAERNEC